MYFSTYTIITTLAALASAATITPLATKEETRRQVSDPHVVDFRTYGAPGCFDDNQGVYTYEESNVGICYEFVDVPVESIFVTDITDGCSGEFFSLLSFFSFSSPPSPVLHPRSSQTGV